jgi:predicted Zn finger-like uncharacterized protein
VNIRCDQCGTTYQLDEALLGPTGSKVRCSRCAHVFWVDSPVGPGKLSEEELEKEFPQPSEEEVMASLKPRSPGKILQGVGRFLLFFLAAASIRVLYLQHHHPDQPFSAIARKTFFLPTDIMGNQRFALQRLSRYFLDNQRMGKIFVVEGEVLNNYSEARELVKIRGTLQQSNRKPQASREVYAGWFLTPEELGKLSFEEINRLPQRLSERFSSGAVIPPSKAAPFMIVFPRPAGELTHVTVEVMSSRKAEPYPAAGPFK